MISTIADETNIQAMSALLNSGMLFSSTGVSGKSVPENRHNKPKTTSDASKIHFLISIQLLNSYAKL